MWLVGEPLLSVQGRAVKAGMMIARGQQLLMADADGATRISDLAKLEAVMKGPTDPGALPPPPPPPPPLQAHLSLTPFLQLVV